ncbi:MAG: RNA polymerase sigma factor [Chloroflexi bacterium]|nr:RNA polymerase sigma factor [Chloroflexota bacterium]MBU1747929.1 RNA polymerase sigma factor [Chloroflexota bacterium]
MDSSNDLALRCQAGDPEAFDLLFDQYKDLVYRTAVALVKQPEEAEDVVQEVFLRVHRAMDRFDPERGRFTTWLYQITVNYCRSRLRRKRFFTMPWQQDQLDERVPGEPLVEKQILKDEFQQILWEEVNLLGEKHRLVVVMHYYLELPCEQIAEILGCRVGTVYSRLHTARHRLQERLERQGISA